MAIRAPKTFDNVVQNADGTRTYFKDGDSLTYDADGFPLFDSKGDVYLSPKHLLSKDPDGHFKAANEAMGNALRSIPSLATELGFSDEAVAHFLKNPSTKKPPKLYTWHHHQDTGRMQLVLESEHKLLSGGHVGGHKIWGGGYQ